MTDFPNLAPNLDTRAGRMMAAGTVACTVTSIATGVHVTIRLKCNADNRDRAYAPEVRKNWVPCPLADATHVFVEVPNASGEWPDKVGTMYPKTGRWYADSNADPAREFAARAAILHVNSALPDKWKEQCTVQEEERCGECFRTLTDPVSIERGIGPECFGKGTGSQHQVKEKADAVMLEAIAPGADKLPLEVVDRLENRLTVGDTVEHYVDQDQGKVAIIAGPLDVTVDWERGGRSAHHASELTIVTDDSLPMSPGGDGWSADEYGQDAHVPTLEDYARDQGMSVASVESESSRQMADVLMSMTDDELELAYRNADARDDERRRDVYDREMRRRGAVVIDSYNRQLMAAIEALGEPLAPGEYKVTVLQDSILIEPASQRRRSTGALAR